MRGRRRHRPLSRLWGVAMAASALLWLAGATPGHAGEPPPLFPHADHLEEGADCTDCHVPAPKTRKPTAPGSPGSPTWKLNPEACEDCHDQAPKAWRLPGRGRSLRIRFAHDKHVGKVQCLSCHKATIDGSHKKGEPLLSQPRCVGCHKERKVRLSRRNCVACHGSDRRRTPPKSHRKAWKLRHPAASRFAEGGPHGSDCALCHRPAACVACHLSEKPRSHNGLWRVRTHGIAASWDRENCRTCHETGVCIGCHRSTQPPNHRGAWRQVHGLAAVSKGNEHCQACHGRGWCEACHTGERR